MAQNSISCERAWNVYKRLKGLVGLYKPPDVSVQYLINTFGEKVCVELNKLKFRPPVKYLDIGKDESGEFVVDIRPSYSDNVLASGPKYTGDHIFLRLSPIGKRSSGVCIIGINKGMNYVNSWVKKNPLKVFHVKGMLGQATQYLYKDEKIVAKAKYDKVHKATIDKILSSFEAAHQRKIYMDLKIDIQSQEAYELAINGMLRPPPGGIPCIYSMKCINFESPHFILEISCVNENENYLLKLIHDLGLHLRTFAHCTGIRCIRYGPFTIKNALLTSQLSLSNILQNLEECKEITKKYNIQLDSQFLTPKSENDAYNKPVEERDMAKRSQPISNRLPLALLGRAVKMF